MVSSMPGSGAPHTTRPLLHRSPSDAPQPFNPKKMTARWWSGRPKVRGRDGWWWNALPLMVAWWICIAPSSDQIRKSARPVVVGRAREPAWASAHVFRAREVGERQRRDASVRRLCRSDSEPGGDASPCRGQVEALASLRESSCSEPERLLASELRDFRSILGPSFSGSPQGVHP